MSTWTATKGKGMKRLQKVLVFIGAWVGCVAVGWLVPYVADPRHDVEWAMGTFIAMAVGAFLGPIVGYWTVKLTSKKGAS